jgi:FdhD protein
MTASCGVCGRQSIETLLARAGRIADETRVAAGQIVELSRTLIEEQPIFARTGGLHAAGVASPTQGFSHVREDVGRHNAVDKALGRLLLDDALPARGRVLVVSGRTSFEIVHKAWMAEVCILVSVSAPSSLAIATAERAGITLIGFSRGGAFNVYANGQRVVPG